MSVSITNLTSCAALLVLLVTTPPGYALQPQQWVFATRYEMDGVAQPLAAVRSEYCLSDAAPIPDIALPGQECSSHLHGRFGDTLTWQLDCSSDWEIVQGAGRLTFKEDIAQGELHLQILSPVDTPQQMVLRLEGRAAGRCGVSATAGARPAPRAPASTPLPDRPADRTVPKPASPADSRPSR